MARKKTSGSLPPFVALLWDVLNSKAYKELPPSSAKALPYFLGKVRLSPRDPGYYAQHIEFPYSEAKVYAFASGTFSKIIRVLVHYGFIDPVERGGLRAFGHSNSKFGLSRRWKDYGKPEFQEVEWLQTTPRLKSSPSPKCEIYSIKNENNEEEKDDGVSQSEAVRG